MKASEFDQQLDQLITNLESLVDLKIKTYKPRILNFMKVLNRKITSEIEKENTHGKKRKTN